MAYQKIGWQNKPSAATPITASRLEHMDEGIYQAHAQLAQKASEASVASVRSQLNQLVLGAVGDGNNPEVIQDRVDFTGLVHSTIKSKSDNIERLITTGKKIIDLYDLVNRAVSDDTGMLTSNTTIRVATEHLYPVEVGTKVTVNVNTGYIASIYWFNEEQTLQSRRYFSEPRDFVNEHPYWRIKVQKSDDTDIMPAEAIANVTIEVVIENYISNELNDAHIDEQNNKYEKIGDYLRTISTELRGIVGVGKNKFNPSDPNVVFGYLDPTKSNDITYTNDTYKTSGFIYVTEGQSYVISPRIRKLLEYDKDKKKIVDTFVDGTFNNYVYTASVTGFVRFTYWTSEENKVMFEKGTEASSYAPYRTEFQNDIYLNDFQMNYIRSVINVFEPKLYDKLLYTFGDSIMAGDGNNGKGIGDLIATKYNMRFTEFALGGSTVGYNSSRSQNQLIYNQVANAVATNIKPDFILFNGLTNDISNDTDSTNPRVPLGTVSSGYNRVSDVSTFTSAFEQICFDLLTNFPNSIIIYVRPHNMASRDKQRQIDYGERALELCRKWGIPYIDMYSMFNTCLEPVRSAFLSDYTHPNETGYVEKYLPPIITKMKELAYW